MTEYGQIIKFSMKKLFLVSLVVSVSCFSQSRDYKKRFKSDFFRFLTQTEEIYYVEDIISKSTKYGFELIRFDDGEIVRKSSTGNFIILEKKLSGDYNPFFPSWSIGSIVKKVFFLGDNIKDAVFLCVITEIYLLEYENVSSSQIKNFHQSTINFIDQYLSSNYTITSKEKNFKKPLYHLYFENKYSFVDKINYYSVKNDITFQKAFSFGKRTESRKIDDGSFVVDTYLGFQHNNEFWDDLIKINDVAESLEANKKSTLKNLRDNIGQTNIRDVNTYDLQEMVQFFLDDCKRSNINVPKIETLSATFEPLDEGVIALAYGMNDDDKIIIRVDPSAWQNSDSIKKWYVLYHELGHDVLNLDHGEGGKMMFNFADREYSWDEFYTDKDYMFNYVIDRQ